MTSADQGRVPDYGGVLRLDGRAFVVVGAGQGIGRQTSHALAANGASVLCVDVDPVLAGEVAEEVDGVAHVADVRRAEEVEDAIAAALASFGRLDGVADVVGMARYAPLVETEEDDWDWTHDIVLRHAYHVVRFGGRALLAQGGGSMAFVASVSGVTSAPFHGAYGAAKAGLLSLVRTAAAELREAGVRVNAVAPGTTATPRRLRSRGPESDADGTLVGPGSTADVASALLFLLSDMSRHVTGQTLAVDGGMLVKYPNELTRPPLGPGRSMGDTTVTAEA